MLVAASSVLPVSPEGVAEEPKKPSVEIQWRQDESAAGRPDKAWVDVRGLSGEAVRILGTFSSHEPRWGEVLSVYAEEGDVFADFDRPSMYGEYSLVEDRVLFEPGFPLRPGVRYRAVVRPGKLSGDDTEKVRSAVFTLPEEARVLTTRVERIAPTVDVVPENQLKFYVHFSGPMSRGHIYDHLELREAGGRRVELPFLEIDEELWDPTMTRLTLFIDPGRIKRGVRPLEEVGPALEEGKSYTLAVRNSWKDARGKPLERAYEKTFRVGGADREPPDPGAWRLSRPRAGTREPLEIGFGEPMDDALARRMIWVTDASGSAIEGEVKLADQERQWQFTPANVWPQGGGNLMVATTIEDLAGNNVGKPFEVDLFNVTRPSQAGTVIRRDIPFR